MKHLVLILGIFGLLGCTSEPPVVETPVVTQEPKKEIKEEPQKELKENQYGLTILRLSCSSLQVIKNIGVADTVSGDEAATLVKRYIKLGVCGVYRPPQPGLLEKLEFSYIDFSGIVSQLWKLKGHDLWTIVAREYVEFIDKPKKEKEEIKPTGHKV